MIFDMIAETWNMHCAIKLAGAWCVTDGWFSLSLYIDNKAQTWWRDHYIRVIRIAVGLALVVWG